MKQSRTWLLTGLVFALAVAEAVVVASSTAERPAAATGAAPEQPEPERLVEFVKVNVDAQPASNTIATKLPIPLEETPANVGVVSAPLIREQQAVVLSDALQNISGVQAVAGVGTFDYFVIRGFDSLSGGLVMTDGAPEPEVTFYPLYNVEGVELLKGPAGFLYGKDPLAGVVNIVRKQPLPLALGRFAGRAGSFGTTEGSVDWNLPGDGGRQAMRVNALWRETEGWRDGVDGRQVAVNPAFAWKIGRTGTLNLNLEYVEAQFMPDAGLPLIGGTRLPDVPRRRSYRSPFDDSDQVLWRLQVDWQAELAEGLSLRQKAYFRDLDWETNGTLFNGVFPSGPGPDDPLIVDRTLTLLDDRQRVMGSQTELVFIRRTGAVQHDLLAGIELSRITDDFTLDIGLLPPIALIDPQESATSLVSFPFLAGDSATRILSPYLIDRVRFSPRWQLLAGLRHDAIRFEDDPSATSRDDSETSPFLGLTFVPTPGTTLYANAGRSFAPAGPRVQGPREPEQSGQIEIGSRRQFFDERLRATLALYQITRENIGIPDDNGVTQQAGDQRSRGVEVELAAEPFAGLRVLLAYAYNRSELTRFAQSVVIGVDPDTQQPIFATFDRSGNVAAFSPRHLLHLWVSRSFQSGIGLAGGARWASRQYIAEDNAYAIDDTLVVDASIYYDWARCRVKLHVENLTDTRYESRGLGSTSVTPGAPFAAYAGFDYRF